jgi:hypothetical protein
MENMARLYCITSQLQFEAEQALRKKQKAKQRAEQRAEKKAAYLTTPEVWLSSSLHSSTVAIESATCSIYFCAVTPMHLRLLGSQESEGKSGEKRGEKSSAASEKTEH